VEVLTAHDETLIRGARAYCPELGSETINQWFHGARVYCPELGTKQNKN